MRGMYTHCPVCKRFCGPASTCPYCDATIPFPPLYRRVRLGAWLVATLGLFLLITASIKRPPETIPIANITPAMQFAQLHFTGELTRVPRISRNRRSASTNLDDGSGSTMRLVFLDEALETLLQMTPLPAASSRIFVRGSLRINANEPPVLFLRNQNDFQILEDIP